MTKNRPPSRLFSWLSQWTRRYSSSDDSPSCDDTSSPSSCSQQQQQPTTTTQATTTEPINVPRPSITLSVAGTIDTCFYSTSSLHSSSNNPSCSSSPRRASATMSEIWKGNEDPLVTMSSNNAATPVAVSLGASYPEKRFSFHHHHHHHNSMSVSPCSPPASVHRPSSVFSLPPPNTASTRTNRDDVRPRLSYDMDVVLSPTLLSYTNSHHHHHQSMTPSTTTTPTTQKQEYVEEEPKQKKNKDSSWPRADRMIIRQELVRLALDG